ncbi:related to DAL5-Allantoate and ureidosuccinate permease [Fusarium fujikuroi]|nr:related to DAL5-Allantoate and ureidosuccinate permease [Fusarium fujikuroi]SCO52148.1 related to DAL5-Allantoate and ureidosuccinate permease [Fusarium fujikuroi]SCV59024.1 related to DAL5-Allantoate and ureidosuccinate permease [Fusarium fujikuroi]
MDLKEGHNLSGPNKAAIELATMDASASVGETNSTFIMTPAEERKLVRKIDLHLVWAGIQMVMAAGKSFASLAVLRILLGAFEAAISPGFTIITSTWYKPSEHALRHGLWYCGASVAYIIGGIIAYGISHINSAIKAWQFLFIIFGAVTFIWGLVVWWLLPTNPQSAWFLNEHERKLAFERVQGARHSVETGEWNYAQMREAFMDPRSWLFFLICVFSTIPGGGMTASLDGKTAIVTGGSRGIGQAISINLARKGLSKLAITYSSNIKAAEETLKICQELGVKQAVAIQADALDPEFGPKTVAQTLERLDTTVIDILVNNAVLADHTKVLSIKDTTLNIFLEIMQANVYAPVSLTTSLLPHLPEYGGRVINISSVLAYQGNADPTVAYGASKTALQSYTRSFAENFSKSKNATFNSVVVGLTATDSIKASQHMMPPGFLDGQIRDITAGNRIGVPDDIVYVVGFLAGEEGRWVNGAAVSANGGNRLLIPVLG